MEGPGTGRRDEGGMGIGFGTGVASRSRVVSGWRELSIGNGVRGDMGVMKGTSEVVALAGGWCGRGVVWSSSERRGDSGAT